MIQKYRCHKEVYAMKIGEFSAPTADGDVIILPADPHNNRRVVACKAYMDKHRPTIGGYYVMYEDGYESFSPAQAFESGYTLIEV